MPIDKEKATKNLPWLHISSDEPVERFQYLETNRELKISLSDFSAKCVKTKNYTVKDSDLNFFWAPKLSAGGLNFGLDSQYGNWNISSLNSPLRGILYSMVWRCNLRVVKVNIAFSCRSFMVQHLIFRFGLKLIMANLFFMFNHMIVCVCQEHKP